jgi:hypothetical protein
MLQTVFSLSRHGQDLAREPRDGGVMDAEGLGDRPAALAGIQVLERFV